MHLLDLYSLASGSKVGKPKISLKYFPLNIEKYITLHTTSKETKSYQYWQETINLILPILQKEGISIIQIGQKDELPIQGCISLLGQTSLNQSCYILSKTLLHAGADSFPVHVCSSMSKKIVGLYSNNYISNVGPYWSKPEDVILLEPERKNGEKPSFMIQGERSINSIAPEKIAKSILKLLNLPYIPQYKTIEIGNQFLTKVVEIIPDQVINPQNLGIPFLVIRGDLLFNEQNIFNQVNLIKSIIFTDRPLNPQVLQQLKNNIAKIIYVLKKEIPPEPNFCKFLQSIKIPCELISWEKEEVINSWKLDFLDVSNSPIMKQSGAIPNKLDINNIEKYFFKTNKIILSNQKIFNSIWSYKQNFSQPDFTPTFQQIKDINLDELWMEGHFCYFAEKNP